MEQIKIIHQIGEGRQKRVYEVKLPSGWSVLAKRCVSSNCVKKGMLEAEARHIANLQKVHGRERVPCITMGNAMQPMLGGSKIHKMLQRK